MHQRSMSTSCIAYMYCRGVTNNTLVNFCANYIIVFILAKAKDIFCYYSISDNIPIYGFSLSPPLHLHSTKCGHLCISPVYFFSYLAGHFFFPLHLHSTKCGHLPLIFSIQISCTSRAISQKFNIYSTAKLELKVNSLNFLFLRVWTGMGMDGYGYGRVWAWTGISFSMFHTNKLAFRHSILYKVL